MYETSTLNRDNRSGVALGSIVGSNLLTCEVMRSGASTPVPIVSWIKNGELVANTSGFSSSLEITDFAASDAGVYQCVFTNTDGNAEIITTAPYRLDTGKN